MISSQNLWEMIAAALMLTLPPQSRQYFPLLSLLN